MLRTPIIGSKTAVIKKPKRASGVWLWNSLPKLTANIRLPAPKNMEKMARPVDKSLVFDDMFGVLSVRSIRDCPDLINWVLCARSILKKAFCENFCRKNR